MSTVPSLLGTATTALTAGSPPRRDHTGRGLGPPTPTADPVGPSTTPGSARRSRGRTPATPTPRPPTDYAGVMPAASWALMLCKPGIRPPVSVEPGTCATAPLNDSLWVGRLSGVSSPPRETWVPAMAGCTIDPNVTVAFTSGRVISVEPLRKPFAMSAGAVRTAAIAADAFPVCTAPVNATALEFSAASALPGAPIESKTNCKPGPKLTDGNSWATVWVGLIVVLRSVSPVIVLVAFCDICARIEPGGIRLVTLCAICAGRAPTGARAPSRPSGVTGTNAGDKILNETGSKPGRNRLCRPSCRAPYAPTGLPANRSPKAVWTPVCKAGTPVITALFVACTDPMTAWAVPIWPLTNICANADGVEKT